MSTTRPSYTSFTPQPPSQVTLQRLVDRSDENQHYFVKQVIEINGKEFTWLSALVKYQVRQSGVQL